MEVIIIIIGLIWVSESNDDASNALSKPIENKNHTEATRIPAEVPKHSHRHQHGWLMADLSKEGS